MKKTVALLGGVLVVAIIVGVLVVLPKQEKTPLGPLQLSPATAFPGDQVRLGETGLLPAEPVDIRITETAVAGPTRLIRSARASLSGRIDDLSVILPQGLPSGAHRLVLTGTFSGRTRVAVVYVRAPSPWITLQNGTLKPRQTVGLILGGFSPRESVTVSWEPAINRPGTATGPAPAPATMATLPTDPAGNSTWNRLKIPVRDAGKYTVVARGRQSRLEVRKTVDLQPYTPLLDLSPRYGPPGVTFSLNAHGFEPGETVQVYFGSATAAASHATADRYGNAWGVAKLRVPYETLAGPIEVKVVGADTGASATQSFTVQKPKPWLELSVYSGAPGAGINLSGGGWAADDRITIHLGSAKNPAIGQVQADGYGWLQPTPAIYIPLGATYQVVIVAVGQYSHASASATFKIVYPFGLRPTPVPTPSAAQS